MYKNKWIEEFSKYDNKKVLLMLSGGKDSSACLHILKTANVDVTAIHFTHKWGSNISTNEARKLCEKLGVKLLEIDFSDSYYNAIRGYKGGRPCLLCKPKMYEIVIEELKKNDYGWVCIGDNANDRTTIVRLLDYIKEANEDNIYCSTYFGSERGIKLPEKTRVLRPLLDLESDEVEEYLKENGIEIKKNNSTGDKYFEYAREGCPIQFHDPGYEITMKNMDNLQKYNSLITEFARENNIRASIHLPSTFVITIPIGFEKKAGEYLEKNGLKVDWAVNGEYNLGKEHTVITIKNIDKEIFNNNIQEKLFNRFFERLEQKIKKCESHKYSNEIEYMYEVSGGTAKFSYREVLGTLSIDVILDKKFETDILSNLVVEIFRRRSFSIMKEII